MRLIDADKLMEYCQNLKERKIDCNDIARFPTSYDVDKVVEELENLVKVVYEDMDGNIHLRYSMETILKAIEIVKVGVE